MISILSKPIRRQYSPKPAILAIVYAAAMIVPNAVFAADEDTTQTQETGTPTYCDPADNCKIPYEYLSSEQTNPYLVSGKPPTKRADIKAARRWPDVRSCLVRKEQQAERPDIAKIDWKRMRRAEDIEVCLFRLAASIGGPQGMRNWFQSQGLNEVIVESYYVRLTDQNIVRVRGLNSVKKSGKLYLAHLSVFHRMLEKFFVLGETFSVIWTEDGQLIATSYETGRII